ncbi:MAG TPA: methyltransferase [Acidimicrobiia bacterium]|nr:methyltransferase [Acidimicrobiia bacterium]
MADTTNDELRPLLQQLIFGFFPSAVVSVAARLRIPDLVADGPKSSDELAEETDTDPPSLYRLLRACAYLGILEGTESRHFGLTDMGELLRSDVPGSMWATTQLFCGEHVWRSWGDLMAGVQTGKPSYDRGIGSEPFTDFAENPEASRNFNRAMSEGTLREAPGVLASYDFAQFSTLVDVGGGDGTLLAAVLAATPGLHGVLYDTASGSAEAPDRLRAAGVDDRCEVVVGDFFDAVPDSADAYIMKSVIHDWDDDRCVTILSNCRRAMKADGKVLVLEPVLPSVVKPSFALLGVIMSDLNMLMNTGGKERTEDEFASILSSADLQLMGVSRVPKPSTLSVIESVAAS